MKRIVSIQDISCVGKCSLTVALPIISAAGVETAVIPTAVLSTHTAFSEFTFRDLTEDIEKISAHWQREKFDFDAIYTGYLGSFEQLDLVSKFFDDFKTEKNRIVVDPAMADNGKLYTGFTPDFAKAMANEVCAKADIIVPNITEACYMLGESYIQSGYSEDYIKGLLLKLTQLGAKCAVLTGVSFDDSKLGVMSYDSETGEFFSYYNDKLPVSFHGTGDIFASSFTGALVNDMSVSDALKVAVDYTCECIKVTMADPDYNWYGVNFEQAIPTYLKLLGK